MGLLAISDPHVGYRAFATVRRRAREALGGLGMPPAPIYLGTTVRRAGPAEESAA